MSFLLYYLKKISVILLFPFFLYFFIKNWLIARKYVYEHYDPGINVRYLNFYKLLFWYCFFSGKKIKILNQTFISHTPVIYFFASNSQKNKYFFLNSLYSRSAKALPTFIINESITKKAWSIILDLIDVLTWKTSDDTLERLIKQSNFNIKQQQSILVSYSDNATAIKYLQLAYKNTIPIIPVHIYDSSTKNKLVFTLSEPIRSHKYLNLTPEKLLTVIENTIKLLSKECEYFLNKEEKKYNKHHKEIITEIKNKLKSLIKK